MGAVKITLADYVVCRVVLGEKMLANPSDEKYRRTYESLRRAYEQETEREANQDQLPMLLRRQAGGF